MKKYVYALMMFGIILLFLMLYETEDKSRIKYEAQYYDSLFELLDEVNAEHQGIKKPEITEYEIIHKWGRGGLSYTPDYEHYTPIIDGILTSEQAKNDVNMLFYQLQTRYGAYEYFGGDEIFDAAKMSIFESIEKSAYLTADELTHILADGLYFINDGHFTINGKQLFNLILPYHYRNIAYEKTENGYRTIEDKKQVAYIEGYEDWKELFRRSLSDDGDIVYYPVTLKESSLEEITIPENLIVHYENGDTETLTSQPYEITHNKETPNMELYKNQSIPILSIKEINPMLLEYNLAHEPMAIVDLRFSNGGNGLVPFLWMRDYTGVYVSGNFYSIEYYISYPSYKGYDEDVQNIVNGRSISEEIALNFTGQDEFIENENVLVILTSKATVSAAEGFVDLCRNVNNTIVIGEPTAGILSMSASGHAFSLPAGNISVRFGDTVNIFPGDGYFEEGRGLMPDLWIPANMAEEAAVKFIHKMAKHLVFNNASGE